MLIILTILNNTNKIQENFCFKVRLYWEWLAERQKNNTLAAIYDNSLCDSLTRKETYDQRTFTSQLANETFLVKT